jgi:hypothetical protein
MNTNVISAVIGQLGAHPRAFLAGWIEGRHRYQVAACKDVIAGSIIPRGSIGFAASQAAVAFYQALDED